MKRFIWLVVLCALALTAPVAAASGLWVTLTGSVAATTGGYNVTITTTRTGGTRSEASRVYIDLRCSGGGGSGGTTQPAGWTDNHDTTAVNVFFISATYPYPGYCASWTATAYDGPAISTATSVSDPISGTTP